MPFASNHPVRRTTTGFTLIEITVALVIVVVMASLIVPRFTGTERRHFESVAEQVSDLMMVYAQRDRLSHKQIGIFHDPQRHWLTVVLLEDEDGPNTDQYGWRVDPLVPPVKLPDNVEVVAYEDGQMIDFSHWPITNRTDQTRPMVQLALSTDEYSATVTLSPHDVSPKMWLSSGIGSRESSYRKPLELDSGGRNREEW